MSEIERKAPEAKEAALADEKLEAVDGGYTYSDGKFLNPDSKTIEFQQTILVSR